MRGWKGEHVAPLRISVDFVQATGRSTWVATYEFSSDPRAIPAYETFALRWTPEGARITGMATGIRGTSYRSASWSLSRTTHFWIYHSPYRLRGRDRRFLGALEAQRATFEQRFGVKVASTIAYYYYPEQRLLAPLTAGACGTSPGFVGCADPDTQPPTIHTSEWPSFHEPIHIYQAALEPPPKGKIEYVAPLFIAEGMAVALEDRQVDPRLSDYCSDLSYVPLDSCAQQSIGDVEPMSLLRDGGFNRADPGDAYSLGGSFVKYLILKYGYRTFGKFYYVLAAQPSDRERDYDVATHAVYRQSIRQLLGSWRSALCRSGVC
jgi:hypothetical protein